MPHPDLEIRWGRSSRPLDKRGGGAVSKNLFSVWSKIKGGPGPQAPPPDPPLLYYTIIPLVSCHYRSYTLLNFWFGRLDRLQKPAGYYTKEYPQGRAAGNSVT